MASIITASLDLINPQGQRRPAAPLEQKVLETFYGRRQAHPTWCWAAVAESIHTYYGLQGLPGFTSIWQCQIAKCKMGVETCDAPSDPRNGCCEARRCWLNPDVDQSYVLSEILRDLGHLQEDNPINGAIGLDAFRDEIMADHPVPIRVKLPRNYHFLVVVGYDYLSRQIAIWDPESDEKRSIDIDGVEHSYGQWENSYLTAMQ